ncbi:MAG: hypothetical protein ACXQS7_05260 [Candidatus Syntropharchaeia archaeon]
MTLLGEVILSLRRIRGKGIPLYSMVEFEPGNYQSDIKAISVDSAVKMSYRDSRDEINSLVMFHHQLKFTSSRYNFNLTFYKS